jgi:arylsulfatase A-like enzyme
MKYKTLMIALLVLALSACKEEKQTGPPNIIILLVDDAGYADFGFMGSEDLQTPNLDELAAGGMIFTDAHVSATVCAPSRAGLLTGNYQQRFGFECNALTHFEGIDTSQATIAEVLQTAGYKTAAFGKWHVGDIPEARPPSRGFDYSWTFLSGARSYFPNEKEDQEGHIKSIRENDQFTTFEGYLTDALGQKAVEFIDRNKRSPFFIYWSPNAVHTPMEATEEDLARFEGHPRQKLAAMTWALDRAVGRIKEKLEQEGLMDNTLLFFLSDNGGASNNQSSNLPLKGYKGNKYEGGHRIAFFAHWPDRIPKGQVFDGLTSSLDIFATAVDVSGGATQETDGVSLLPYFTGEKTGDPHQKLFWRKEGMAAARDGSHKLIRVDSLGVRLYDLENDLRETQDLSLSDTTRLIEMQKELSGWEKGLMAPLWVESKEWNEVTWWVHYDLFHNQKVRATSPAELKQLKLAQEH